MLNNISLIASIISALTAVTTSLRALGKSRENARYDTGLKIKAGCRVEDYGQTAPKDSSLITHFIVTLIWFVLSIIFALPVLFHRFSTEGLAGLFLWTLPFIIVAAVISFIWWKTLHARN